MRRPLSPRQLGAGPRTDPPAKPPTPTQYLPFGPAGEVHPEGSTEQRDIVHQWLAHVQATCNG